MTRATGRRLLTVAIVVSVILTCTAGLAQVHPPPTHTVRAGDTLSSLARRYNVSIDELIRLNNLTNPHLLSIGTELVIATVPQIHVVTRGDTLYALAQHYNTDVDTLVSLNNIRNPHALSIGQELIIPMEGQEMPVTAVIARAAPAAAEQPAPAEAKPDQSLAHTVARGDTLWDLAQRHGTTPQAIAMASGISVTSMLRVGQKLAIPAGDTARWVGAEAIPWSEVSRLFPVGMTARVTDVRSGLQFTIIRRGGTHHADCEPRTAADSAVINRIWGGWSWSRRSIVVEIGQYRIAASMHSMPHGQQGITNNNFPGHFCVHFHNSRTHGSTYTASGLPVACPEHQACVRAAIGH